MINRTAENAQHTKNGHTLCSAHSGNPGGL